MSKYKAGALKSGGSGKRVKSQAQAVAIMLSEKRAAQGGKAEYQAKGSMENKGECKTCMGRKVEYHSPPKHPEQDDPYAAMDAMTEKATKGQPGTLEQMRKEMKPMQRESPKAAQGLYDYIKRFTGSK